MVLTKKIKGLLETRADQWRDRYWVWKMGKTKGNSRPINRGKQTLMTTHPGILHLIFWGWGKYPTVSPEHRLFYGQAGMRRIDPLQLEGLESKGMHLFPPRLYTMRKKGKSILIPQKETGKSSEGEWNMFSTKPKQRNKQTNNKRPVSTTISKTFHKREPEIQKSV